MKEHFLSELEYIKDSLLGQVRDSLEGIENGDYEYLGDIEYNMKDVLWEAFIEKYLSDDEKELLGELEEKE